jgi:hemin uptake protein HemP
MTERHWPSAQDKGDHDAGDNAPTGTPRRVPLSRILGNDREIVIAFNGADYRLRITRNQKLILTK